MNGPNANELLRCQRASILRLRALVTADCGTKKTQFQDEIEIEAIKLAEFCAALDESIMTGRGLPRAWVPE